mmetsp:Transcript_27598/g.57756  ORF Transcript_27598/g.57756 Transcript_27598/m.57756 type:complete len:141 (-) Transcript_27598:1009-1431(-)
MMMGTRSSCWTIVLLLLTALFAQPVLSWSVSPPLNRRAFFGQASLGVAVVTTAATATQPQPAQAYPQREVGGEDRSATTAAMNRQAYETNNRLESQGFKLDTPEEEKARLSAAMGSFSYDASTAASNKKNGKVGGNKTKK